MSRSAAAGRVAGIDYGTVRIGIAISNPERTIASPLENYTRRGPEQDAQRFRRLVEEEGVVLFVVGLPIHLDGGESQKSLEARQFGQWLHEATGVPV
jgi:putative holliday junction resolvase